MSLFVLYPVRLLRMIFCEVLGFFRLACFFVFVLVLALFFSLLFLSRLSFCDELGTVTTSVSKCLKEVPKGSA